MEMKKVLLFVLFLLCSAFVIPQMVYAHFPATDGPMTVILHVDPDDSPIPGEQATLHFLFEASKEHFSLPKCLCFVTISEGGKKLLSQKVTTSANKAVLWDDAVNFTFPKRDIYTIILSGKPTVAKEFKPFSLTWYFRVDQYPPAQIQQQQHQSFIFFILGYFSIFLITGVVLYFVIWR
jgi:hypothetical protein